MIFQKAYGLLNEAGSNVFISCTQFLSKHHWTRTPDQWPDTLGQGDFRYRVNRGWCKAASKDFPVKNCHEMVVSSSGQLHLLTDHPRNNLITFDPDGRVLGSWTLNMSGAHGLTLTSDGDEERLWICDPYRGLVVKTTLDGRILQTLPEPHALGIYSPWKPYAPTQTAVAPNGDIYVADGYGAQHVVQFNAAGQYIRHFGGKGQAAGKLDFAHGIAVDARRGAGNEILLVTSRRQSCIKRFSLEGQYLGKLSLPGGYPCRPVIHGMNLLISLCWSGAHLRPNTGFVLILDEHDRLCATLGGGAERDAQGRLLRLHPTYECFHHVHDVCADSSGNLYVCQWNAGGIYPIRLEPLQKSWFTA